MTQPQANEAASYYFRYIDLARTDDIVSYLDKQMNETLPFLKNISEEQSLHRYAPDKWSIREVISHVNDTERVFVFRALWFARGFDTPLPSFDQDVAVAGADADERSWASHIDEFTAIRTATSAFFDSVPAQTWDRPPPH